MIMQILNSGLESTGGQNVNICKKQTIEVN